MVCFMENILLLVVAIALLTLSILLFIRYIRNNKKILTGQR